MSDIIIADLSNNNTSTNLSNYPASGYIFKLTEGTNFFDSKVKYYIANARKAKKPFGLYHFMNRQNWQAQADFFIANFKPYIGEAFPVLDYEQYGRQGTDIAKKWLDYVTQKTGVKPLVYTSASVTKEENWSKIAPTYKLWVADYTPPLDKIGYWTKPTLWQYTDTPYDKSYFYGSLTDFKALAKSGTHKPTPEKPSKLPSLEKLASETQAGKYGNGETRKKKLGHLYTGIQAIINHRAKPNETEKAVTILAKETLKGVYGNGNDRKARLGNYYNLVQAKINKM